MPICTHVLFEKNEQAKYLLLDTLTKYHAQKAINQDLMQCQNMILLGSSTTIMEVTAWTIKKTQTLRHDGARYVLSPWSLTWDDENYYLVAYDESSKKIKHFRVDKMRDTQVEPVYRQGKEQFEHFDLAAYAKKTFGMYGGHDESVTLICKNSLAGVVLDRFGNDIMMHEIDEEHFMASVQVSVSRQFFGWVTGIGKDMHIQSPVSVRKEYQEYMREIMVSYEE